MAEYRKEQLVIAFIVGWLLGRHSSQQRETRPKWLDKPLPTQIAASAATAFMFVAVPGILIGLTMGGLVSWIVAGVGVVIAVVLQKQWLAEARPSCVTDGGR